MSALKVPRPRALSAAAAVKFEPPALALFGKCAGHFHSFAEPELHLSFLLYARQTWTAPVVVASRTLPRSSTHADGTLRLSLHPHSPRRQRCDRRRCTTRSGASPRRAVRRVGMRLESRMQSSRPNGICASRNSVVSSLGRRSPALDETDTEFPSLLQVTSRSSSQAGEMLPQDR